MSVNDFNNSSFDDQPASFSKPMHFKVTNYEAKLDKEKKKEYIDIELTADDDRTANVRQYLNKNDDGSYKQHIFAGGTTKDGAVILPSVSFEIIEFAKAFMGEEKYEAIKKKYGEDDKVTRQVFQHLSFEIPTKDIKTKDDREFLIPMFAYNLQKDEEYRNGVAGSLKQNPEPTKPEISNDEIFEDE